MVTEKIVIEAQFKGHNVAKNIRALGLAMGMTQKQFKKMHDDTGRLKKTFSLTKTTLGRLGLGFRKMVSGLRGFRMEMLSVMFFGMNMQRFFVGLLKPALEATGIFKLWSSTLKLLFLPIALKILDILLPWFEKIMNLSEGTKLLIGKLVLFGAAMGLFLFLLGSVALGIGGIILVFGNLFGILTKFLAFGVLKTLAGGFFAFIPAIPGIEKIRDVVSNLWDKIKESEFLSGLIKKLKDTFGGLWDTIKENDAIDSFLQKFSGGSFELFVKSIEDKLVDMGIVIKDWVVLVAQKLGSNAENWEELRDIVEKKVNKINFWVSVLKVFIVTQMNIIIDKLLNMDWQQWKDNAVKAFTEILESARDKLGLLFIIFATLRGAAIGSVAGPFGTFFGGVFGGASALALIAEESPKEFFEGRQSFPSFQNPTSLFDQMTINIMVDPNNQTVTEATVQMDIG